MLTFWSIKFESKDGLGYLIRDSDGSVKIYYEDGTLVPDEPAYSYTTIDTNPSLPIWAGTIIDSVMQVNPPTPRQLPTSQFIELFTPAESMAIESSQEPHVRQFMQLIHAPDVTEIDLGNSMVQGAIHLLEQIGLIGVGRATQILGA